MKLSERIKKVGASQTLAITQKAGELKKKGVDVISFGAGEPDFDTPGPIIQAAKSALDEGYTHYGPVAGLPELKRAISKHISEKCGVQYGPNQIIATCGAKSAIFIALQVMLNTGDEVIIPAPYWVSYPDQVILAGGVPKIIKTREGNEFKITTNELKKAISNKAKVLIINSPSNPVGSIYSREELHEIIELCISNKITIIADEIYDRLVYEGEFCSALEAHPSAPDHTIYINGVSKSHAMTGWRMGYAAGPTEVIAAMAKYQGQLLTCIPPFIQKAVITALTAPADIIKGMIDQFRSRRELIIDLINKIPDLSYVKPAGAFYTFVNIEKHLGKNYNGTTLDSSQKLAEYLLDEAHVAVVPGSAFGVEGYIRLSFATSEENIRKGLERIREWLSE